MAKAQGNKLSERLHRHMPMGTAPMNQRRPRFSLICGCYGLLPTNIYSTRAREGGKRGARCLSRTYSVQKRTRRNNGAATCARHHRCCVSDHGRPTKGPPAIHNKPSDGRERGKKLRRRCRVLCRCACRQTINNESRDMFTYFSLWLLLLFNINDVRAANV